MDTNSPERIDNLDRKILKIITQHARTPFKDVAEQCGVSRVAIHQRVTKLFDMGVIIGSGYQINPKMLGYNLCVYVGITLEKGYMYNDVVRALEQIPEVVESQFTLGNFSMLGKIQCIPGVSKTETLTSLEQRIHRELPIE